jgi:hypothetical protein
VKDENNIDFRNESLMALGASCASTSLTIFSGYYMQMLKFLSSNNVLMSDDNISDS